MNAEKNSKKFDCVESVRKERDRIAKETEGKSAKEVLEYFKKRRKQYKALQKQ
ncbi:MAG: hypothetical protein WD048_14415 [Chitinophagales bacterium]